MIQATITAKQLLEVCEKAAPKIMERARRTSSVTQTGLCNDHLNLCTKLHRFASFIIEVNGSGHFVTVTEELSILLAYLP